MAKPVTQERDSAWQNGNARTENDLADEPKAAAWVKR